MGANYSDVRLQIQVHEHSVLFLFSPAPVLFFPAPPAFSTDLLWWHLLQTVTRRIHSSWVRSAWSCWEAFGQGAQQEMWLHREVEALFGCCQMGCRGLAWRSQCCCCAESLMDPEMDYDHQTIQEKLCILTSWCWFRSRQKTGSAQR